MDLNIKLDKELDNQYNKLQLLNNNNNLKNRMFYKFMDKNLKMLLINGDSLLVLVVDKIYKNMHS